MNPKNAHLNDMNDMNDDYGDEWSFDGESEHPDQNGSEGLEGSGDEDDEVQITHDPLHPIHPVASNPPPKSTQRPKSVVMRRKITHEVVTIPRIIAKREEWATILERGEKDLPERFFKEREVATAMKSKNAVYIIAYYLSILNTDPSYMDIPKTCPENGFRGYHRGPFTDHDYEDFRMILGVVVAYITAYLMYFNIEISSAMRAYDNSVQFDWSSRFRTWSEGGPPGTTAGWVFFRAEDYPEFNPQFMRFITPFNFMYVRWNDFKGIVDHLLSAWALDDKTRWVELAQGAYRRMKVRGEYLQLNMVKTRMYLWKKWRGDPGILYGMARTKVDRDRLESYQHIHGHPYDYLQTSISGHKMEHTPAEVDYEEIVHDLGDDYGDMSDVFPGSPVSPFDYPTDDSKFEEYRQLENDSARLTKRRQGETIEPNARDVAAKKKPKSNPGPPRRRSTSGSAVAPSVDNPNAGWPVQHDTRETLDDDSGPVQRDARMWAGIKANLQVLNTLSETLMSLAKVVQETNANMPTMVQWIDKNMENRTRHAQKMREARVQKKQLQGTPQGDSSTADMLVQLASASESMGGSYRGHEHEGTLGHRQTMVTSSSSSSSSSSHHQPRTTQQQTSRVAPRVASPPDRRGGHTARPTGRPVEAARGPRGTTDLGINPSYESGSSARGGRTVSGDRRGRGGHSSGEPRIPRRERPRSRSPTPTDDTTAPPPATHLGTELAQTLPATQVAPTLPAGSAQGQPVVPVPAVNPFQGFTPEMQAAMFQQFMAQAMQSGMMMPIQPQGSAPVTVEPLITPPVVPPPPPVPTVQPAIPLAPTQEAIVPAVPPPPVFPPLPDGPPPSDSTAANQQSVRDTTAVVPTGDGSSGTLEEGEEVQSA